jgi:hypothetical protein
MAAKLDGSFSGLWTCELCGHTGDECHCEHYNRGGNVWGHHGTVISESELAAEYWRLIIAYYRTGLEEYKEQAQTVLRFAENPSYEDLDNDYKEP